MKAKMVLLLIITFALSTAQKCKKNVNAESPSYFDCETYNYFKNENLRIYTEEDSIALVK